MKGTRSAIVGISEAVNMMAETMGERHYKAIVGDTVVFQRPTHLGVQTVSDQNERNVVGRVRSLRGGDSGTVHSIVVDAFAQDDKIRRSGIRYPFGERVYTDS